MNYIGIILGAAAFLLIGIFHPIVIKAEYHWGKQCWPLFAIVGIGLCIAGLIIENITLSAILGVAGFSCFWSIHELFQQEKRVQKGWFPKNPKKY
ncbi:MAG: DUF4491 family protein [Bacteroidales bacterium]|nr:DUF4491 family protein [Bacteroidales bacterium]